MSHYKAKDSSVLHSLRKPPHDEEIGITKNSTVIVREPDVDTTLDFGVHTNIHAFIRELSRPVSTARASGASHLLALGEAMVSWHHPRAKAIVEGSRRGPK